MEDKKNFDFQGCSDGLIFRGSGGEQTNTVLVCPDQVLEEDRCHYLVKLFEPEYRAYILTRELPRGEKVLEYTREIIAGLVERKVRRLTVFGCRAGGSLAQAIALQETRLVRRLVLLDATTRIRPQLGTRMLDQAERLLPLGLPFRSASKDFDSRSKLHRITCPTLVLVSGNANSFLRNQANILAERIPNSWLKVVATASSHQSLEAAAALTKDFITIPAKQPQKSSKRY